MNRSTDQKTFRGDRPHIALKTERGGGVISTKAIALGQGDAHITGLAQAMSDSGKPVFLRPLGEMNNTLAPYCGCRGSSANSPKWFRKAFQRIYLISHGGTADELSRKLRGLGMPGVSGDVPENPYPQLTIVWNPLAVGEPPVRGNHYRDYFPGKAYIDAYGNNYYNTSGSYAWHRTTELYRAYPGKPFMFPEWGMTVDDPGYVRSFADFVRKHRRVRFASFYNGRSGGAFDLARKPRSRAAYRRYVVPLSR